jgi:hypothetical protein
MARGRRRARGPSGSQTIRRTELADVEASMTTANAGAAVREAAVVDLSTRMSAGPVLCVRLYAVGGTTGDLQLLIGRSPAVRPGFLVPARNEMLRLAVRASWPATLMAGPQPASSKMLLELRHCGCTPAKLFKFKQAEMEAAGTPSSLRRHSTRSACCRSPSAGRKGSPVLGQSKGQCSGIPEIIQKLKSGIRIAISTIGLIVIVTG